GVETSQETVELLIAFSKEHLPGFKTPRTIDFIEDLPRLPSGKIQRRLVRAPYWAGRDKQI
ncbi:MAG: long-chain acyl-CoA synthetase, partial [Candidatus Azotimanducaceae bacterium]